MRFQLVLNKSFCPTPPPLIPQRLKHSQITKITKQCFLPPPHWFSTQSSQYQNLKANKWFILTVIELGPPVLESSTGSQNFRPPLIFNTNGNRALPTHRIQSGIVLIGNPHSLTTTLCSTTNGGDS